MPSLAIAAQRHLGLCPFYWPENRSSGFSASAQGIWGGLRWRLHRFVAQEHAGGPISPVFLATSVNYPDLLQNRYLEHWGRERGAGQVKQVWCLGPKLALERVK